jgi:hypothetical protein
MTEKKTTATKEGTPTSNAPPPEEIERPAEGATDAKAKVRAFSPHNFGAVEYETTLEEIDKDIARGKWTGAGSGSS